MKIKEVTDYLEKIAPPSLQEGYDNAGYIVGDPEEKVKGILCCLDSTEEVIEEAIKKECNLIIAHHPIIFSGLKSITGSTYVERTVLKAIRNHITIYAIHTNLDHVLENGVNTKIAEVLGLEPLGVLRPHSNIHPSSPDSKIGAGLLAALRVPMEERDFLHHVRERLQCGCIKHTQLLNKPVRHVAICGGSGQFLMEDAIHSGADMFVTADFKYHDYFDADGKIVIADVGHYESEQFTAVLLYEIITKKFSTFAAYISETITNPIKYLV